MEGPTSSDECLDFVNDFTKRKSALVFLLPPNIAGSNLSLKHLTYTTPFLHQMKQ